MAIERPFKAHYYFRRIAPRKHRELRRLERLVPFILLALSDPIRTVPDKQGRTCRWVYVDWADKYLRVVVLSDGETVFNAFFDKDFEP